MTANDLNDLSVCNTALTLIAGGDVQNITDPETDIEAHCAVLYPLVRNSIFARHPWKCAHPVRELAVNADKTPINGYSYAHKLPSNLIAGPFAVYDSGHSDRAVLNWKNAEDHIHSDYPALWVKYRIHPPVNIWPAYIFDLVVTALAARLAKPVADNTAIGEEMREIAFGPPGLDGNGGLFAEAKRLDGTTSPVVSLFGGGNFLTATRR